MSVKIGQNIVALRESVNLRQVQLSKKLSITRHALGRIERGEVSPTLDTLNEIALALDVSTQELLRGVDSEDT